MDTRLLFVLGLCLTVACLLPVPADAAACATAWSCSTSYNSGAVVSYGGHNYTMLYSRAAGCPGYAPNVDNWWRDDGVCGTSGTATPTARPRATARPGSTATATARATATPRARATATASGTCNYPNWVQGQYYNVGAIVRYAANGQYYRCTNANPGYDPTVSTWYWSPYSCSGGTSPTATPTRTATPSGGVTKPGEVPSDQWSYMVSATQRLGRSADYSWLLAAVVKKESAFGAGLGGSPSSGDGLMQVEPNTRSAYSSQFSATFGHAYNHASYADQIGLGALILHDKINRFGGSYYEGLLRYNGGDNWYPGATDSYGRVIDAPGYASAVMSTYRSYGGTHQ